MEALDVAAGHEMLARAADHDATDIRIALEARRRLDQPVGHLRRQRIERGRPVEGDGADAVLHLDQDMLLRHGSPPFPPCGASTACPRRPRQPRSLSGKWDGSATFGVIASAAKQSPSSNGAVPV